MNGHEDHGMESGAPRGAGVMNVVRWALFAVLLVAAVLSTVFWVRQRSGERAGAGTRAQAAQHAIWRCPMHPSYTSDRPGECPICGMTLEKVEHDASTHAAAGAQGDVPGLTTVEITPERIQRIGVRTAIAASASLAGSASLVGFVAPDEARLARVQLRVAGWVRSMTVGRTGERVAAGQPLLTLYSPELYQAEREYLIERFAADSLATPMHGEAGAHATHEAGASAAGRARLQRLGLPDDEIDRLERERSAHDVVTLRSPVSGSVLERNAVEGQSVTADMPLLTVADLSRVWVLVDLYEMDLGRVTVGDPVRFTAEGLPGRTFAGRIDLVYPTVSSETRTVKARLALDNRDGALRPGMFGRVEITPRGRAAVTVPSESVIRTGREDYVFLAHAGGRFEPRRVHLGESTGDAVQVLHGLAAGDTVVASASFLIDSESRLKAAIAGLGAEGAAPAPTGHVHGGRR